MKNKTKRRRISLNGKTVLTADPADWIIGQEQDGVWTFICRGSITTFNPVRPKEFNVERMTREQVKERLALYKQHGSGILLGLKPVLFAEFKRAIGSKVHFHEVASLDDGAKADQRELRQREREHTEKQQDAMRLLFKDRGHS